jgi:hypothetical protein
MLTFSFPFTLITSTLSSSLRSSDKYMYVLLLGSLETISSMIKSCTSALSISQNKKNEKSTREKAGEKQKKNRVATLPSVRYPPCQMTIVTDDYTRNARQTGTDYVCFLNRSYFTDAQRHRDT